MNKTTPEHRAINERVKMRQAQLRAEKQTAASTAVPGERAVASSTNWQIENTKREIERRRLASHIKVNGGAAATPFPTVSEETAVAPTAVSLELKWVETKHEVVELTKQHPWLVFADKRTWFSKKYPELVKQYTQLVQEMEKIAERVCREREANGLVNRLFARVEVSEYLRGIYEEMHPRPLVKSTETATNEMTVVSTGAGDGSLPTHLPFFVGIANKLNRTEIKNRELAFQTYMLARAIDPTGAGWVRFSEIKRILIDDLNRCKTRQLQLVIKTDLFFKPYNKADGRLFYQGLGSVAHRLKLASLGRPVMVPTNEFLLKNGVRNYHNAAFKTKVATVSRWTTTAVTGLSKPTQIRAEKAAETKKRRNIYIDRSTLYSDKQPLVNEGLQVFPFVSKRETGGAVLCAVEISPTYLTGLQDGAYGRRKYVNKQLRDRLVFNGDDTSHAQGNRRNLQRRYFDNANHATKQANRGAENVYLATNKTAIIPDCYQRSKISVVGIWERLA